MIRAEQKAWFKPIIGMVLIIVFVILGWRFFYFQHKNADNLPHLENLTIDDLDDLIGYQPGTLRNIWGDPHQTRDNTIIYDLSNDQSLVLTIQFDRVCDATIQIE